MRRATWVLLLVFAFAVPWEYSLDLGEPLGNIARVTGLLVLLVAVPRVGAMAGVGALCVVLLLVLLDD